MRQFLLKMYTERIENGVEERKGWSLDMPDNEDFQCHGKT